MIDIDNAVRYSQQLGVARNNARYAWLRWLVLLAAGFFSLMVGQLAGKAFGILPMLALKASLIANAFGILSGAIALYAEIDIARKLAQAQKAQISACLEAEDAPAPSDV